MLHARLLLLINFILTLTWRFFCLAGVLFVTHLHAQDTLTRHFVVHPSSSVCIQGKTNINKYQCAIQKFSGNDTLILATPRGKSAIFKRGWINVNTTHFDCGLNAITNDFRKSIQAETYPFIIIKFISLERAPKFGNTEEQFLTRVIIKLANKAVPCEIMCCIVKDKNNLIHLSGNHNFKFSDFDLTPPQKMKGMIQVEEDIQIDFHLVMSTL